MRLVDRLNHALEPHLPEQRLFLRSARGTRFVRFRPVTMAAILAGAGIGLAWSIFATAVFFMDVIGDGNVREQKMLEQTLYEERLNKLAADRDQRSAEAESAIRRFYTALDKVSDMQTELLASEERQRELETAIDVLQGKLRNALRDREAATKRADALAAELGRLTGSVRTTAGELDELRATTDYLAGVLTETAEARDAAVRAALDAEGREKDVRRRLLLAQERSERVFARLEDAIAVSVEPLEKVFRKVGLDPDRLIASVRAGYSGQGGPLTPIAMSTKGEPEDEMARRANAILDRLDEINLYRIAAERIPLDTPLRSSYRITSRFGMRNDPKGAGRRMHEGVDMAGSRGTPILAPADGVVTFAGTMRGYGLHVRIRHADGFETRYGHLSRIRVKKGQKVSRGDRIGDMGNTGRSTGTHLHYEVRRNGKPQDPMTFIRAGHDVF